MHQNCVRQFYSKLNLLAEPLKEAHRTLRSCSTQREWHISYLVTRVSYLGRLVCDCNLTRRGNIPCNKFCCVSVPFHDHSRKFSRLWRIKLMQFQYMSAVADVCPITRQKLCSFLKQFSDVAALKSVLTVHAPLVIMYSVWHKSLYWYTKVLRLCSLAEILFIYNGWPSPWAGIAQSVQRLPTAWTVRGSKLFAPVQTNPGAPLSLLYNGYRVFFPGVKRWGAWP
jgi:hypothetical protein